MIYLGVVPFAFAVALALFARAIAAKLPPAIASALLTVVALSVALTTGLILSASAVVSLARLPMVGAAGHWSAAAVGRHGAPPLWVGVLTATVVIGLLAASGLRACRSATELRAATKAVRGLEIPSSNLVVLDHDRPTAYAVGGVHGRIVVSTSMLRALPADERLVLLAHERAHIHHHHHVYVQLCDIAAAANPLLRPTARAVRISVERWADESAAREVGDRTLVARGLARAALARHGSAASLAGTLAAADNDVVVRVQALLQRQSTYRWRLSITLILAATACWVGAGVVAVRAHELIELAEAVYSR